MQASNNPALSARADFSPESRLWVYTANRPLTESESALAQQHLDAFCRQWTAHNHALKAAAEVFAGQYIILMVDETQAGASGCSIDKSVHFLERLGAELDIDFFERMRFAWVGDDGTLHFAQRPEFATLVREGHIRPETFVTDTLVQTKRQLNERWLVPFAESWHRRLA